MARFSPVLGTHPFATFNRIYEPANDLKIQLKMNLCWLQKETAKSPIK